MMTQRHIAIAQVGLSAVFLFGYFGLLWLFLSGKYLDPNEWRDAVIALLGVVTGSVGTIVAFWFSRSRPVDER
jgi:Zn-dependent protease with chaperone function